MSHPALPEPAYADHDSMLSRKFGREVANYFSGSPLNRVSFLRPDHTFLSTALRHPTTRFLLFKDLQPLVLDNPTAGKASKPSNTSAPSIASGQDASNTSTGSVTAEQKEIERNFISSAPYLLAKVRHTDIAPLIGEDPYSKTEAQLIEEYDSTITVPQMIFLGLDESESAATAQTPGASDKGDPTGSDKLRWKKVGANAKPGAEEYAGHPLFAVDVTPKGTAASAAEKVISSVEKQEMHFLEGRMLLGFEASEAAIYANARHLLDWNQRNPFCAGCGQPTLSTNAGHKRTCPPTDRSRLKGAIGSTTGEKPSAQRADCATRKGISNLSFPRTDPTVIMAVVSHDGGKVLLGRQKRFPPGWYSTLAGFLEPGESVEEAVRREVWEEAGVRVGRVVVHSTQPWPYPANLMVGAIGSAIPGAGSEIDLGNDPELEDAKWYTIEELRQALRHGTMGIGESAPEGYKGVRLPPATAIANLLITSLVEGFAGAGSEKL